MSRVSFKINVRVSIVFTVDRCQGEYGEERDRSARGRVRAGGWGMEGLGLTGANTVQTS